MSTKESLENPETKICETICIEVIISKKKWCVLFE